MKKYAAFILAFICYSSFGQVQIITTIAGGNGGGFPFPAGDGGQATAAGLLPVYGAAVDTNGSIFICGGGGYPVPGFYMSKVRKVNPAGIITAFAGRDTSGYSGDGGPATAAQISEPSDIAFDRKGNVYIAEMNGNGRVRKVDAAGIITTYAGNGSFTPSGDGGPATAAGLGGGVGICFDTAGNLYIAAGSKIRRVDTAGIITTFAGTGTGSGSGDGGPATAAGISTQGHITIDRYGCMYIAEPIGQRVRKINAAGIITTVAGTGVAGYNGDNRPATTAQLDNPSGVFTDDCDNLYIADSRNHRIRVVNGSGHIKTFAGTGFGAGTNIGGYSGDGGPATAARLSGPSAVCLDKNGSMYIADLYNVRVRYIQMSGCTNTTGTSPQPSAQMSFDKLRMTVRPNPSSGTFSVVVSSGIDEQADVVVTNVVGSVVASFTATTNREKEVRLHVPAGVYIVRASTAGGKWVEKVVVE